MKVKHIKGFELELPGKPPFAISTEFDFPKLHTLFTASGIKGSGKSVAVANLLRKCRKMGYFDKIYLISPTYKSNKPIWDICGIQEEDVIEPTTDAIFQLIDRVGEEKKQWDDYQEKKAAYLKFMKDKKNLSRVTDEDIIIYYDMLFLDGKKPEWKYPKHDGKECPPRLCCVCDDILCTDVIAKRSSGLNNAVIKHRHIHEIGVSLFFLLQSYSCHDGLGRIVRENIGVLLLFPVNDENQLKKIKTEANLPISEEEFTEITKYAWDRPFSFLYIDFFPHCRRYMFKKGFGEYLIVPSLENLICECEKCKNKKGKKVKETNIFEIKNKIENDLKTNQV